MVGISNKTEVICCFCGIEMDIEDAMIMIVYPNIKTDEGQQLFCHRKHFIEKLDKSVIFYLDNLNE